MNLQTIILDNNSETLIITINRPEKLNAINQLFLQELAMVINDFNENSNYKSAIIIGQGEKSFVAGADISEFLSYSENDQLSDIGQKLFFLIENAPKPIVACVNGFAFGGGCELAMACHFRIASENAQFAQSEINLGIIPGWGGSQRLIQLIGKSKAIELMLTGNKINAQQALDWGLINAIYPISELKLKTLELMALINSKSQIAVKGVLKSANAYYQKDVDGYEIEQKQFKECFFSQDGQEGIQAFLEKRKPTFNKK